MQSTLSHSVPVPDVTVSIVSYNTRELLRSCLASLLAREAEGEAGLEIIVVDNGSTDGSLEMVRDEFPSVILRHGHGNIGYGRANNLAFDQSHGRYFWVLNSDTEIWPGAIATMLAWMEQTPKAGACSIQLMMPDGTIQDSYALEPTLLGVFYEQTRLHLLFGGRTLGIRSLTRDDYTVRQTVEQVVGACLFVRREAYAQVGGFDPAYFMYFEDTDFCVRLRHAGWEIWFLPEARILHLVGGSSQDEWRTRALMVSCYNASRYYFYHRYQGARAGKILKILVFVGAFIRLTGWTARALVQTSAHDKVLLFRDVLRRTTRMNPHNPGN